MAGAPLKCCQDAIIPASTAPAMTSEISSARHDAWHFPPSGKYFEMGGLLTERREWQRSTLFAGLPIFGVPVWKLADQCVSGAHTWAPTCLRAWAVGQTTLFPTWWKGALSVWRSVLIHFPVECIVCRGNYGILVKNTEAECGLSLLDFWLLNPERGTLRPLK